MDFLNTPEKLDRRMTHVPMGRFGEAVEQAKAVVFRMSPFLILQKRYRKGGADE
jgi:NAD(P)-dependent dehydrogenase (short-subunit alcohol dehydrogenase family)